MKLAMVMKVKDEDDILDDTLRYHAAQGVDFFVVTDNGSADRTPEILGRWVDAGRMHVLDEPSADFRDQAHWWVTRMARLAATDHGADWVLHTDADEFWWPVAGDLKQSLESVPDPYGVVVAPRIEFVPRPDEPGSFFDRLTIRETRSSLRPKLAHRAEPDVVLRRGAHDIDVERGEDGMPKAGRPVLRGVRDDDPDDDRRLIFAPAWPLRVMHFPLRSFDQYRRRVEVMLAGSYEDRARRELREHDDAGRLPELFAKIAYADEDVESGLRGGSLTRDERLRDFMASCPDSAAAARGERASIRPTPSPEAARAEMDEIAFDAMRAVTRTEQGLIRQRDELRQRLERRERQLRRTRRRLRKRPRGMRARIGALLGRD
jgi:Glycosyl transferase family 2